MKLAFRAPSSPKDREFVISSWLDSSRSSYSSGLCPMHMWYAREWPIREWYIDHPSIKTLLAYEKDDPDFLYGWVCADPSVQSIPDKSGSVHYWPALVLYVYVKQSYRKEGVARRLFQAVGVDVSKPFLYASNTVTASRIASKVPLARFNPLAARYMEERK